MNAPPTTTQSNNAQSASPAVQSSPQLDGSVKLATMISPIFKEIAASIVTSVNQTIITNTQDIMLRIGDLETQMRALDTMIASKKIPVTRNKPSGGQTEPAVSADGTVTTTAPQSVTSVPTVFPNNKMVWFRNSWKASEEFRAQFLTPEIAAEMEGIKDIIGKTGPQRHIAEANHYWKSIEKNEPIKKKIAAMWTTDKERFELQNKHVQEVSEPHTPPTQ